VLREAFAAKARRDAGAGSGPDQQEMTRVNIADHRSITGIER
jgi:hypothetical protein